MELLPRTMGATITTGLQQITFDSLDFEKYLLHRRRIILQTDADQTGKYDWWIPK